MSIRVYCRYKHNLSHRHLLLLEVIFYLADSSLVIAESPCGIIQSISELEMNFKNIEILIKL